MGALKQYDPKEVTITWDGVFLNEGIASGTFITIARNVRQFTLNVGGDGGGTRVRNPDRSATVTVTMRMGSQTNALLSDRILDEEADPPIPHITTLTIKDNSGNTLVEAPEAFLDGPPDTTFGTEEGTLEWTFLCLEMTVDVRGNLEAS